MNPTSTPNTAPSTAPDTALTRRVVSSPIGDLTLLASATHLVAVLWPGDDHARVRVDVGAAVEGTNEVLDATAAQLDEYFAGDRLDFDLPLDADGTDFQCDAWVGLRQIPYGTTVTYGEQAAAIGRPTAVRAIGAANGRNPLSIVVPCHRVVGADGSLTGFAGGIEAKRYLLDHEAAHRADSPGANPR